MEGDAPDSHIAIHQRLLQGDKTASEALVRECLTPVIAILRRRHLVVPRDMIADAACDALLAHIQSPSRFDSGRSQLLSYLAMIAERRLVDQIRAARRWASREIHVGVHSDIDDWLGGRRPISPSPSAHAGPVEWSTELEQVVALALPDARDRELLALICEGRQSTEEYAALLGVGDLPLQEQRAHIKRSRDRVLNRLRRRREEIRRLRSLTDE